MDFTIKNVVTEESLSMLAYSPKRITGGLQHQRCEIFVERDNKKVKNVRGM